LPADSIIGVGFLDVEFKRIPIVGQAGGELIGRVQNPGVAGLGGKKYERSDVDDTPTRYAYRFTDKGVKVALLFVLFHQRLCGPLANNLFHHRPEAKFQPDSKLETALHKADNSIRNVIQLLEANQHC
jgi:hypothetical protein